MNYDNTDLDNIEYDMIVSQIEELSSKLIQFQSNEMINTRQQINKIQEILSSTNFALTWRNITNAIEHELYLKIAISISMIIQKYNITDDAIHSGTKGIEFILEKVKESGSLDVDIEEIEFIRNLVDRAKVFKPQKAITRNLQPISNPNGMYLTFEKSLLYKALPRSIF